MPHVNYREGAFLNSPSNLLRLHLFKTHCSPQVVSIKPADDPIEGAVCWHHTATPWPIAVGCYQVHAQELNMAVSELTILLRVAFASALSNCIVGERLSHDIWFPLDRYMYPLYKHVRRISL